MKKKVTCKTRKVYILFVISLITIALLTAVGIYCYQIKQKSKQKHLLLSHDTNKLKKIDIKNRLLKNKNGE